MPTAPPDAFDALWSPDERAAAREACGDKARAAALAQVAAIPFEKLSAESRAVFAESMARSWVAAFDASVARSGTVLRSPEALGRERLARILLLRTGLSAEVIVGLLGAIGDDVFVMSMAGVR